jgi:predicted Zn-dependent protease with MMP-like domain
MQPRQAQSKGPRPRFEVASGISCTDCLLETNSSPVDKNEIRQEVARVLDKLPRQFRKQLHNVEVVVEEWPEEELFLDAGLDPEQDTLYGLYQGIPLPDRSSIYPPILPDKITIFSEPLLRDFPDPDELRKQIRTTVLHEIAHYFGFDDDEIDKLGY